MKNKIIATITVIALIITVGIVGNMDRKMMEQELVWENSIQALQMEQEKIQANIETTQAILKDTEERSLAQGILISEIWERMHLDFFLAAEAGELE